MALWRCGRYLAQAVGQRPGFQRAWFSSKYGKHLSDEAADIILISRLIASFREYGHYAAMLDPLGRALGPTGFDEFDTHLGDDAEETSIPFREQPVDLLKLLRGFPDKLVDDEGKTVSLERYVGLRDTRPGRKFYLADELTAADSKREWWSLRSVVELMKDTYCGHVGIQYDHLPSRPERKWIESRAEKYIRTPPWVHRATMVSLLRADAFESFFKEKFPSTKRFGLEGCESLIPGLMALLQRAGESGVQEVRLGMAHRGRLNVLCNVLGKEVGKLCTEMNGQQSEFHVGDVKYHLGMDGHVSYSPEGTGILHVGEDKYKLGSFRGALPERAWRPDGGRGGAASSRALDHKSEREGASLSIKITPNPSHLEMVTSVIMGMTRARQEELGAGSAAVARAAVIPLIIHGDASFSGLGIVPETLNLGALKDYSCGGSIHVIINNQVGFTTDPWQSRSSPQPSDMAKVIGAPIFHVNADDPEAVVRVFQWAVDWRQEHGHSVVINLVGYRRYGHNEMDDPSITQPVMYRQIAEHPSTLSIYSRRLLKEGVVKKDEVRKWEKKVRRAYEEAFEDASRFQEDELSFWARHWQGEALRRQNIDRLPTGLPLATLQSVGRRITTLPEGLEPHKHIERLMKARSRMTSEGARVDWGMAEHLALGTLLMREDQEGRPGSLLPAWTVRLSGQDSERGTFNHRHAVIRDMASGSRFVPLNHMMPRHLQRKLHVCNSPLSEAAVLGFEYGYSVESDKKALTIWEAQFGDFANNAQVMIDQFIASGEDKWGQESGLVLLLPHGYDGQGPDHSSARMERFLQMMNDDADHLPGASPRQRRDIERAFDVADKDGSGALGRNEVAIVFDNMLANDPDILGSRSGDPKAEAIDLLWQELQLSQDGDDMITKDRWMQMMMAFYRRNAEKEANMFIVNVSTPANFFHVLRRQVNRPFSKPLVIFSPKYLLHHRPCTSAIEDFTTGTHFMRVLWDGRERGDNTRHMGVGRAGETLTLPAEQVRRVLVCCGQLYYRLSQHRRAHKNRDTVLVRLEQIAPFPYDILSKCLMGYPNAEVVWVQEEPKNMGAWPYVRPRLNTAMRELFGREAETVKYMGRPPAASTATASHVIHRGEEKELLEHALFGDVEG